MSSSWGGVVPVHLQRRTRAGVAPRSHARASGLRMARPSAFPLRALGRAIESRLHGPPGVGAWAGGLAHRDCGRRRLPPDRRHHRQPAHGPDLEGLRLALWDQRVRLVRPGDLLRQVDGLRGRPRVRGLRDLPRQVQWRPGVLAVHRRQPRRHVQRRLGAERLPGVELRDSVRAHVRGGGRVHRTARGRCIVRRMPPVQWCVRPGLWRAGRRSTARRMSSALTPSPRPTGSRPVRRSMTPALRSTLCSTISPPGPARRLAPMGKTGAAWGTSPGPHRSRPRPRSSRKRFTTDSRQPRSRTRRRFGVPKVRTPSPATTRSANARVTTPGTARRRCQRLRGIQPT